MNHFCNSRFCKDLSCAVLAMVPENAKLIWVNYEDSVV